jgi:hypothetical protein
MNEDRSFTEKLEDYAHHVLKFVRSYPLWCLLGSFVLGALIF